MRGAFPIRRFLTAALMCLVLAAPALASPIVAIQDDRLEDASGKTLASRLDGLAATQTRVTRVDVHWARVAPRQPANPYNPADPAYDWSHYDAVLLGLRAKGISAIVDFYDTPAWAVSGEDPSACPHPDGSPCNAAPTADDAAAFAGALARRYNGASTASDGTRLPLVRRIEVWNEPNIAYFYSPQCRLGPDGRWAADSPRSYAGILSAAYRQIKLANPDAIVIGGVTGPVGGGRCTNAESSVGTLAFASQIATWLPPDAPALDAWSQHLYPIGPPRTSDSFPSWRTLPRLFPTLDRLTTAGTGIRTKMPVYITETGYHSSYNRFHRYFVSERQQASWLTQTYLMAESFPRVQIAVWFNLQDNGSWTGGLLRADGSKKPAWGRFLALSALAGQTPAGW